MGWVTMHSLGAAVIARHDSLTREWVHLAKRCTGGVVHTELLGVFGDGSGSKRGDCCIEDMGRSGFGGQTVAGVRQGLGQGGLEVCDLAVSHTHALSYVDAAQRPLGCASKREGCKESEHGGHVRSRGNSFTPVVFESYGALGARGMEVFQQLVSMADIQADSPEEVARLRGALSLEHQRRLSLTACITAR